MNFNKFRTFCLLTVVSLSCVAPAAASTLQIQFSGADVVYDGATIYDAGDPALANGTDPNKADPLETITFLVDGSQEGVLVAPPSGGDLIYIDLEIPDVTGLSKDGGVIVTDGSPSGTLELLMPGVGLTLGLGEATISYFPLVEDSIEFAFVGSVATISGQSLPFGLELGDPVSVSLSAQIDILSLSDDGVNLDAFSAAGTGEVKGTAVPEPSAMVLAAAALVLVGRSCL